MKQLLLFCWLTISLINVGIGQCVDNGTLKNESGDFFFDNLIDCDNGDVTFNDAGGDARLIFRNSVTLNSLTVNFQNGNKPITIVIEDGVTVTIANNLTFGGQPDKDKFLVVEGTLDVGETLDFGDIEFEIDGEGDISAKNITGGGDTTCSADSGGSGTCPSFTVEENCTGGGICGDSALPIELKSFTASKLNNTIDLNWITAKEENFSHFEIERSINKSDWEQIGIVKGIGESNTDVYYDFTDKEGPIGKLYYRLKAVDIDATFEYHKVIQIENGFNGSLKVSQNPSKNSSSIKLLIPQNFDDKIDYVGLYDLSGVKIKEVRAFEADKDFSFGRALKSGMYILKVNHNGLQENIRVIIQ